MWKLVDRKEGTYPGRDLYSVNFADYLPQTLKRDPKMKALAAAATEQMLGVSAEINHVLIYYRIDELAEELVDILAFDMHVDWYDDSYPLEKKREILKNSVKVHKKMGTKYAVETALRAVCKDTYISEWFQYGGKPYYFRIYVDVGTDGMLEEAYFDILRKVRFYKNLRSHCEGIYTNLKGTQAVLHTAAAGRLGTILKVKARKAEKLQTKERLCVRPVLRTALRVKVKAKKVYEIKGSAKLLTIQGGKISEELKVKAKTPDTEIRGRILEEE